MCAGNELSIACCLCRILCMDSLGDYHDKKIPTRSIRKWLNSEWQRLRGDEAFSKDGRPAPLVFQQKSIPLVSVKVPIQNCGSRCGVYTARFGYNLFVMRNMRFTASLIRNSCESISSSSAFNFGDSDMDRFRAEIKALIQKLSAEYLNAKYAVSGSRSSSSSSSSSISSSSSSSSSSTNTNSTNSTNSTTSTSINSTTSSMTTD